ncbi:MAG: hypothetical protein AB1791_16945 [Chloroflexota bacterium]
MIIESYSIYQSNRLRPVARPSLVARPLRFLLFWLVLVGGLATRPELAAGQARPAAERSDGQGAAVYLPIVRTAGDNCQPIPGANYGILNVIPPPADRPAAAHGDLNLALRGYDPTNAYLGLVDYAGMIDPNAPQLPGLFLDNRTGVFVAAYQVHHWDWGCNCRGPVITYPDVTLAGLAVAPGETIHVPPSGYEIGGGYEVLVLYAEPERITLKYTAEDNVVWGYTLHVEDVCVDPNLLSLYEQWNEAGRDYLPALTAGQAFGRAQGDEIGVAIRDTGAFMDPRSRKDWWQGR